eukprot:gene32075-41593_t
MSVESSDSIAEGNSLSIDQRFLNLTSDDVVQTAELPVDANYIAMNRALEEVCNQSNEYFGDDTTAWKLLIEKPLKAAQSFKKVIILIDSLDEGGSDGRIISLLVDIDNLLTDENNIRDNRINFIVTTRPEKELLEALKSHWVGARFKEFSPSKLRGDNSNKDGPNLPLLMSLNRLIQEATPTDLDAAYAPRDSQVGFKIADSDQDSRRLLHQSSFAAIYPKQLGDKQMRIIDNEKRYYDWISGDFRDTVVLVRSESLKALTPKFGHHSLEAIKALF